MTGGEQNSGKPGWRGKKSGSEASGSAWRKPSAQNPANKSAGKPEGWWKTKKDRSYERAVQRHRLKTGAWFLLSLVLVAGFLVWILWRPVSTPLLAVAAIDYQAPLPPNAWAAEDIDRLHLLADEDIISPFENNRWIPGDSVDHWLAGLRSELDKKIPSGPDPDGTVIIYLSIHGVVDGSGRPCLLPPGTSLHGADGADAESKNWLPVRRLLEYLFVEDRPHRASQGSKKLLILDCNRIGADWSFGVLHNTFAARLKEVVEEISEKAPNLAVLNSTSPDQIAWSAPELRGSVFGYYVAGGLRGAADLDDDGQVTMSELHRYLKTEVNLWVTVNRTDTQTPMLVSSGPDFALVHVAERKAFELPEYKTDSRWKEKVAQRWQRHAELQKNVPQRLQPLEWQAYQRGLLRLEKLVDAGAEYSGQFDAAIVDLDRLADKLSEDTSRDGLAAHSLPLALAFGEIDNRSRLAIEKQLQQKLTAIEEKATGKKKIDVKSDTKSEAAKPDKNSADSKAPPAKKPSVEKPPAKDPSAKKPPAKTKQTKKPAGALVEQHFLAMLQDYLDPKVWGDVGNPARRALRIRREAEVAATPLDVRAQYWAVAAVAAGDSRRRLAEDNLFVGTTASLVLADRLWSEAQRDGYRRAEQLATEAQKALALRDRSWSKTVYLAAWLFGRLPDSDLPQMESQLDTLRGLIDGTHRLAAELDVSSSTGQWDAAKTKIVEGCLDELLEAYFDECQELSSAGLEEQTLRGIDTVLSVPLVTGKARNQLRQRYLDIAERRAADWRQIASNPDGSRRSVERAATEDRFATYLRRLSYWQKQRPQQPEHPVLSILTRDIVAADIAASDEQRLRDVIGKREQFDAADDKAAAFESDRFYERQGALVRRWLGRIGPDDPLCKQWTRQTRALMADAEASATAARAPCGKAVRLLRAAAPLLARQPWDEADQDPVRQLHGLDLRNLMFWQASRALDDFLGPARDQKVSFFQLATADYIRSGKSLCREAAGAYFDKTDLEALLAARIEAAVGGIRLEPQGYLSVEDPKDMPDIAHQTTLTLSGALPPGEAAFYVQQSQTDDRADNGPRKTIKLCPPSMPLIVGQNKSKPDSRRIGLAVEVGADHKAVDRLEYSIPNTEMLSAQQYLTTVALYRGHRWSGEFRAVPWRGVQIAWQRPAYQKPRVTVHGEAGQRLPIVFIFDCSASMGKNYATPTKLRIQVARDTLISILRRLAGPNTPYLIGLRIYAHRTGWKDRDSDDIVIWDAKTKGTIPLSAANNSHPNSDVELIGSPPKEGGILAQHDLGWLLDKLTEAASHPTGETPLYLAIIQAMDDFAKEPGYKHIIVITDGKNRQAEVSNSPKGALKDAGQVNAALKAHPNVRLDIVGFDITEDEEVEKLKSLAEKSKGGKFFSATNPKTLMDSLEKSLQLSRYTVRRLGHNGRTVTPNQKALDLNQPCVIDQAKGNRLDYIAEIVVDSEPKPHAKMTLEGGEAIVLDLNRDRRRLEFRRYTSKNQRRVVKGLPKQQLNPSPRFDIAFDIPQWDGDNLRFVLSVQNADATRFSPRPAEAWLEIRPNLSDASKSSSNYVFDNLEFQPERPVPVLDYLAPKWPDAAESATLQIWFKLKKTPPDKRITLADFEKQKRLAIDALPGVTFTCSREKVDGRYRVTVTARHRRGDTDIHTTKVEIHPPPVSITRRYSPEAGIVSHTFICDDVSSTPIGRHELRFTTRKSLQDGAVTLPRPMTIRVPDKGW